MTWIFGPVPSRRFGRSLGIDLFSQKTCTFDCVYCEVGRTPETTNETARFAPAEEVVAELSAYLSDHHDDLPDVITFAGSGEPTLHREIQRIIEAIHEMTTLPVVLLTNGSLLHREAVLARVLGVDSLVPSLDAGSPEVFARINRPHRALSFEKLTDGLLAARAAFTGHYLLEVLLVQDLNTSDEELEQIHQWVVRIQPDAVQINTVFRPPAEPGVRAASEERIQHLARLVGDKAKPVAYYSRTGHRRRIQGALLRGVILKTVSIRPCTEEELADSIGVEAAALRSAVAHLVAQGKVRTVMHEGLPHIAPAPPPTPA